MKIKKKKVREVYRKDLQVLHLLHRKIHVLHQIDAPLVETEADITGIQVEINFLGRKSVGSVHRKLLQTIKIPIPYAVLQRNEGKYFLEESPVPVRSIRECLQEKLNGPEYLRIFLL